MTTRNARRTLQMAGVGTAALLALSACSSSDDSSSVKSGSSAPASSSDKPSGTVTVFAAASLKESFTALGKEFEAQHPGTKVTFSFGGSDSLAASITGGAPADVFAAASPKTMKIVTDAGTPPARPPPSSATSWRSQPCRATPTRSPP